MNYDDDERIAPKTKIPQLFKLVEENKKLFINELKEAVSIPSVFTPEHVNDVLKMLQFCSDKLEMLGATIDLMDGNDENSTGLPPVIFAEYFVDEEYKTICVYGNIDNVLPAETENNSDYSPFKMIEKGGRLYACGISDNKAPLLCWFNALKVYKLSKNPVPVNIKFVIEGTSESCSKSLLNALQRNRKFFTNVEYICMTIDKRINEMPCLKYGYRGLCNFSLKIICGEKRVHSGTYGGAFNQPLMDGVNIMGSLVDKDGKLVIEEFLKDVKPITEIDNELCKKQFFPAESIKRENNIKALSHKEITSRIIMHKTRLPSFTVNAFHIISAGADKDDCASIPNKIKARFSVRLVLNQNIRRTCRQFERHIEKVWHRNKSANTYTLKLNLGFEPWQEDPLSNHYEAAATAIKTVFNKSPIYVAEGSTMPAVSIFGKNCPASNIVVMPISGYNDNHHSNLESISIENYIQGVKLAITYMCEIHELTYKNE